MTSLNEGEDNFQSMVLEQFNQLNQRLDKLQSEVELIEYKFDTYQKASDGLPRAFSHYCRHCCGISSSAFPSFLCISYQQSMLYPDCSLASRKLQARSQ